MEIKDDIVIVKCSHCIWLEKEVPDGKMWHCPLTGETVYGEEIRTVMSKCPLKDDPFRIVTCDIETGKPIIII